MNHFWVRFFNDFKQKLLVSRKIKGLENEQKILILPLFIFTQITSDGDRFLAFLECNFHHSNFSLISLLNWILHFVNQNKNRFIKLTVKYSSKLKIILQAEITVYQIYRFNQDLDLSFLSIPAHAQRVFPQQFSVTDWFKWVIQYDSFKFWIRRSTKTVFIAPSSQFQFENVS